MICSWPVDARFATETNCLLAAHYPNDDDNDDEGGDDNTDPPGDCADLVTFGGACKTEDVE